MEQKAIHNPSKPAKEIPLAILGTGRYLPEKVLSNADLEKMVDTSDEWITTRTGIKERRIAAANQNTSDLATLASKKALANAGIVAEQLECVVVATVTPDRIFPSTACYLQRKIGAKNAFAYDISAACSGFIYALNIVANFIKPSEQEIQSGDYPERFALVIGAEKISSLIDWTDRNTCVLFGDGAGAVVISNKPKNNGALLASSLRTDSDYSGILDVIALENTNSKNGKKNQAYEKIEKPDFGEIQPHQKPTIRMAGREVFKKAVNIMSEVSLEVIERAGIGIKDIDFLVPHQANLRIIDAINNKLKLPPEQVAIYLEKTGNTSAAAIPLALNMAYEEGKIKTGDNILMVAFGAGLTWGANIVRWD